MTIEIHKPELEALILEQVRRGEDIEDVLIRVLRAPPTPPLAALVNWRTVRGLARGGESLTKALIEERAAESAHDEARIQGH